MANVKNGLLYYNSETDRFKSDIRIKRLKKDMGCDGYAVYEYILNEIYRVGGCFLVWDESTAFDVAEYWGLKETKVNEIVRYCCAVGLFDKALLSNGNVLTSSSIQSRYVEICIRARRKGIIIPEKFDILPEESRKMLEKYLKMHTKQMKMREESSIITEESHIITEESPKNAEVCDKVIKVNKEISLSRDKERFPPPELLDMPLKECYSELAGNRSWAETVTMNTRNAGHGEFTIEMFQMFLKRFFGKLQNEGVSEKSPKDAMSHFARWLNIELNKQSLHENNRSNYTSKQEANDYAFGLLMQHKRELEEGVPGAVERPF